MKIVSILLKWFSPKLWDMVHSDVLLSLSVLVYYDAIWHYTIYDNDPENMSSKEKSI